MDMIIKHFWVLFYYVGNFKVINNVPMEAHMTLNNTSMLYGDDTFLSSIIWKLSGAVNGHY